MKILKVFSLETFMYMVSYTVMLDKMPVSTGFSTFKTMYIYGLFDMIKLNVT